MWKSTVEPGRPQSMRMRTARWLPQATNTHSEYVLPTAFSTATMVARTRLSIKLYGHCQSCSKLRKSVTPSPETALSRRA
jgi:hypothetical protein